MLIKRILKSIFIAVFCVFCVCGFSYADDPNATTNTTDPNAPQQQVNQFTPEDASQFHSRVSQEINDFQSIGHAKIELDEKGTTIVKGINNYEEKFCISYTDVPVCWTGIHILQARLSRL